MRRPSAINTKVQEDIYNAFSSAAPNSNTNLDEASSPYALYDNNLSDSDSFSENSKKIRKKRNTYQKISDDIRVDLLEAVKNGETLKAAAKRHKINYSSAKSILHTYRKEGRILKKSAQERTIKKKVLSSPESERPEKIFKSTRKENEHSAYNSRKTPQSITPLAERKKFQTDNTQYNEEESPMKSVKDLNANYNNLMKLQHTENNSDIKASIEAPKPLKEEESTRRMLTVMDHVDTTAMNYTGHVEGLHTNRMGYREETPKQKEGKLFENFFMNYSDSHPNDIAYGHAYVEGPECTNYMYFPREFDSFNDMVTSLQGSQPHAEDYYARGFNIPNGMEDKHIKMEHGTHYEESGESYLNCPLKSFMDTQSMFREALRKASFFSYNGNTTGVRKSSMDFF